MPKLQEGQDVFAVRTLARSGALILSAVAIAAACGGGSAQSQGPTQAVTPTQAITSTQAAGGPTAVPASGGGGDCSIISAAKVSSIVGSTLTTQGADPNSCTFIGDFSATTGVTGLNVRTSTSESVGAAKLAFGGGQDLTISGHAAYWATSITGLYVDLGGGNTLVVQIVLASDAAAALDAAQKIAQAILGG